MHSFCAGVSSDDNFLMNLNQFVTQVVKNTNNTVPLCSTKK